MSTRITPPPDRFSIERTGEPDRLAPAIVGPAAPDTAPDCEAALPPALGREPVPARPAWSRGADLEVGHVPEIASLADEKTAGRHCARNRLFGPRHVETHGPKEYDPVRYPTGQILARADYSSR